MKINTEITRDRLCELLCSFLEGDSSWLAKIGDPVFPEGITKKDFHFQTGTRKLDEWGMIYAIATDPDCKITLFVENPDQDDLLKVEVGPKEFQKGLDLMANNEKFNHHWRDILSGNDDIITADVFMQFVIFGENKT